MFAEDELLPLSALHHLAFCERRCALVHVEQVWLDDPRTAEGEILHARVHEQETESRPGCRSARGLRIRSLRLGLIGQADLVEFPLPDGSPCPVEYKRGRPQLHDWDTVQVCAQALCIEEMLGRPVPSGALFYFAIRRRVEVHFTPALRLRVEFLAARLHDFVNAGRTPPPFAPRSPEARRCRSCSLAPLCLPGASARGADVRGYVARSLRQSLGSDPSG